MNNVDKEIESAIEEVNLADAPDVPERRRVIRYVDDDAAEAQAGRGRMGPRQRRDSTTSNMSNISAMSAASGESRLSRRSRSRSVDPGVLLPIEYRSVSYRIEDFPEKKLPDPSKKSAQTTAALAGLDWHKISTEEVCQRLETSQQTGLDDEHVQFARTKYGRNTPSKPKSQLPRKLFGYFFGGFGGILLLGSVLVFISWQPLGNPDPSRANLALAIVLLAVFFIQAFFNGWQDFSSSRVMASITGMLPEDCVLLRNGTQTVVAAPEIVPGDIILLKAGAKLPADVRFLELSPDTKFDRSILTGESAPVNGTIDSTDDNYLETRCIGMQGTHCAAGTGTAVVVSTGDQTVFGKIAALTSRPDTRRTLLQTEILRFVLIICSLAAFFIVVVIVIWGAYLRKVHPDYISVAGLIVSVVSVGIAFVPEGLPIALTASMTIVANIMKRNDVLCKSLKTVETLGSVSVICSDKTGTLTRNKMTVTDCCVSKQVLITPQAVEQISDNSGLKQIRTMSSICNAGEFDISTNNLPLEERTIIGDATDQAVLRFSEALGPHEQERRQWRKEFEIAFNSKNKFMVRVFTPTTKESCIDALGAEGAANFNDGDRLLTIKGAPDILLPRCASVVDESGSVVALDTNTAEAISSIKDAWSAKGKRVILLARKIIRSQAASEYLTENEVMDSSSADLTLVGLLAIVDPPRPEIPEVVETLRRAGIRVFMVTGDFKLTATAIARECGIVTVDPSKVQDVTALNPRLSKDSSPASSSEKGLANDRAALDPLKAIVMSGPDLMNLSDEQWTMLSSYDEIVFARTTPEQKLRIVNEFQKHENIVAMTGDGVNDAPSLKAADIGVAIAGGSDIAIEAADMVLLSSFSSIVQAVLYGRVVYDNLKKTIIYLLPAGTFSEFWPVLTNIIFGLPQILSSFLMIVICCLTDCAAAMTLAFEKPEADVLLRPPRNPKHDKLVDWRLLLHAYGFIGIIECVSSFAMAYWYAQRSGVPFSALWFTYGEYPGLDPTYVQQVLDTCSSIYFVNLVIMQWFNLFATRTRRLSVLQHPPIFSKRTQNLALFPAMAFALVIVFIFCYIPGLQSAIGSSQIPVEHFFLPIGFGMGLLLLDEGRKWWVRRWPRGLLAKAAW